MKKNEDEDFVLTWTFSSTVKGVTAGDVEIPSHTLMEATLAFHASRQLTNGLGRDDYAITGIKTNHKQPQHYDRFDLPPRNPSIGECTFTKRLHRLHEPELVKLGMEVKVA